MSIKKLTPVAAMVLLAGCATSGQTIGDRIHNSISDDTYRDPVTKITYDRKTGNAASIKENWKEACEKSDKLRDPTRIAYGEFVAAKKAYNDGDTEGYFTAKYRYRENLREFAENTQICVQGAAFEAGKSFGCVYDGKTNRVYVRWKSDENGLPLEATSVESCKIEKPTAKDHNNRLRRSDEIQKGCYNHPRPDGAKCTFNINF